MLSNPQAMNSLQAISKSLARTFKKIKFKKVKLIENYEETEAEYKKIKAGIKGLERLIKNLEYYEHGNKLFKGIKESLEYLNNKASMDIYKKTDLFEDAANVGNILEKLESNKDIGRLGKKYSTCFEGISKSKRKFNNQITEVKRQLKEYKHETKHIDFERRRLFNLRYDLELNMNDTGLSEELKTIQINEFKNKSKNILNDMKNFISKNNMEIIMKSIVKYYQKHTDETNELLKDIN